MSNAEMFLNAALLIKLTDRKFKSKQIEQLKLICKSGCQ